MRALALAALRAAAARTAPFAAPFVAAVAAALAAVLAAGVPVGLGTAALAAPLAGCSSLTEPAPAEPFLTESQAAEAGAPKPSLPSTAAVASARIPLPPPSAMAPAGPPPNPNAKVETKDLVVGKGATAKTGDKVSVHYLGTLADGSKFDSSRDRGSPFSFTIGQRGIIRGWNDGVPGMKVGGKRKLTIPSNLGYGDHGMPPKIPPNATLTFEIELLDVTPGAPPVAPQAPGH